MLTLVVGLALLLLYGERLLNFETLRSRLAIWRDAWSLWRQFPLLGVGPGEFYWNYPAFQLIFVNRLIPICLHAHSVWLEYATGWGVAGTCVAWPRCLVWIVSSLETLVACGPRAWHRIGLLAALCRGTWRTRRLTRSRPCRNWLPGISRALALLGVPESNERMTA